MLQQQQKRSSHQYKMASQQQQQQNPNRNQQNPCRNQNHQQQQQFAMPSSIYAQSIGDNHHNPTGPAQAAASDFIYWSPPAAASNTDQIMVEQPTPVSVQQYQRRFGVAPLPPPARPRMGVGGGPPRGVPIHTSTPHLLPVIAASPLRRSNDDEDEPIYCEIARDSPERNRQQGRKRNPTILSII
jgi:hypothetical protein